MKSFFPRWQSRNCSSKTTEWSRLSVKKISLLLIVSSSLLFASHVKAQFVFDGLPNEWPSILNNASIHAKVFVRDANNSNDNQFNSGSHDPGLLSTWGWALGSTNDKGDISNAGAALLAGNIIAFFGDRTAVNGTAQIGFWFFKGDIHPLGTGVENSLFTTEHQVGDLLVLSNFTNGGGTVQLRIYKWVGSGGSEGTLDLVGTTSNAKVNTVSVAIPSAGPFAASDPSTASWTYQGKKVGGTNVPPNTYYTGSYFEGFIDLDDIPGSSRCIQSFLLETRNSHETNASLQDFVQGGFNGVPDPPVVQGDEACINDQPVVLTASCSHTAGTPTWYATATSTTSLGTSDGVSADGSTLTKSGLSAGTHTYYVSCKDGDCESARRAVSAIINPLPSVNGVVTEGENDNSVDDGVTKLGDDVYELRISKTNVANLTATPSGGSGSYTSIQWEALDANAAISFVPNGANAVFTVVSTQGLNTLGYNFKVTLIDSKGCRSEDIVTIVAVPTAILCDVNGPEVVCAGSTTNTYTYLDGLSTLNPDFNYTWSISGNGTINGAPQVNVNSVTVTAGAGAGDYTVTLTITGKVNSLQDPPPCSITADVNLVLLSLDKADVSCNGGTDGSVTATFSGGAAPYKIQINNGTYVGPPVSSPYTFNNLSQGTYTVHVVDANNCDATSSITVGEPLALSCSLLTPLTSASCGSAGNTVTGTITGGTAGYSCSASFDATATAAGWAVTNCAVSGTGITVTYTAGGAGPATLTVIVTDDNDCTSQCAVTLTCTGGHGCTPGFWQGGNGIQFWDSPTDPVAIAVGFYTNTSFYSVFPSIAPGTCGLPTTLKMIDAITLGGGNCNKLVRHGVAGILNATTLPDYPLPSGIANVADLKTAIANAILSGCNCEALASQIAASNELNHENCGQILTQAARNLISVSEAQPDKADDLSINAYPNPYNNVVNFQFASPKSGKAVLEVYDIVGRRLGVVYQGNVSANTPIKVKFNVPPINRGALIYKLSVDNKSVRGKVLPETN